MAYGIQAIAETQHMENKDYTYGFAHFYDQNIVENIMLYNVF